MDRLLSDTVANALDRAIVDASPCVGGDINHAWALELAGGSRAFVKTRPDVPVGEFETEAAGLRWLAAGGARVPEVLAVGPVESPFLALAWIESGRLSASGAEEFGRSLAGVHRAGAPAAGAAPPGAVGALQTGGVEFGDVPGEDWPTHYGERRLRPLLARALERDAIGAAGRRAVESVCDRLVELAGPDEPIARLHGDLWGGNVYPGADGHAWLIDPKAHGGHREIDLAMLRLFGSPAGEAGFSAYAEAYPLADGWEERIDLWQLQPLLVHAVLFGGSYGAAAERAARVYG